ncbi:hypothetical protein K457DRAFT_610323 [Linnemannia elongata AG-77]|uniref:Uncharacterized protein n=1 Tax=Linnemannia elongata AG-77 TaxID=1314771 RepID=A0A197JS88_9FUNG|nr:hypothetical protein K457DRAFT_610323 [Linnemannia elongata AG-77]
MTIVFSSWVYFLLLYFLYTLNTIFCSSPTLLLLETHTPSSFFCSLTSLFIVEPVDKRAAHPGNQNKRVRVHDDNPPLQPINNEDKHQEGCSRGSDPQQPHRPPSNNKQQQHAGSVTGTRLVFCYKEWGARSDRLFYDDQKHYEAKGTSLLTVETITRGRQTTINEFKTANKKESMTQ